MVALGVHWSDRGWRDRAEAGRVVSPPAFAAQSPDSDSEAAYPHAFGRGCTRNAGTAPAVCCASLVPRLKVCFYPRLRSAPQ
ncbi:hypothetical protein XAP412_470028 [Xanthomonas phaseoli pv. phaseoli]|uniref:Uncharacterized protein n=1 Tax=Xanthomonas campestris pv. phaseoli TaxID=317013 RepID=A0AB38E327_XANCH|nr:hypothetical protein XAP6984_520029 [Xanthomonas phaseoli pv. phaseoli]SON86207.1 hypothetical protein XAP412_470028 [Xanthomonas phaseoli pv. phaseoli]SON90507.1 hypothetical protein XAP7430_480077 [Xanthomonas phaseoli pv. phaseoli]